MMGAILATACTSSDKISYPTTERTAVADTLWGETVADPYRWLENDTSAATAQWVEAQNAVTNNYFEVHNVYLVPIRSAARNRVSQIFSVGRNLYLRECYRSVVTQLVGVEYESRLGIE